MTLENSIKEIYSTNKGLFDSRENPPRLDDYFNSPQVTNFTGEVLKTIKLSDALGIAHSRLTEKRVDNYDSNKWNNNYFSSGGFNVISRDLNVIGKFFSDNYIEVTKGYVAHLPHAAATPKNNVDAGVVECVKGPYVTNAGSAYSSSE